MTEFFRSKGTGLAMVTMNAWARAMHRLRPGLSIRGLDHVTLHRARTCRLPRTSTSAFSACASS